MTNLNPTINPGDTIALGDVHGRDDLFIQFLDAVQGSRANVILLGDLVDRGPGDLTVLELAHAIYKDPGDFGLSGFNVIRGNHEQMLIDAASGADFPLWVQNGGNVDQADALFAFAPWLESLPLFLTFDDTLFVHGGIRPGVLISEQDPDDLIWIRQPFLNGNLRLDKVFPDGRITRVVHGHSPMRAMYHHDTKPEVTNQRVNLDTGAYFTGVLTAYNATQNAFMQFQEAACLQPA